MRLLFQRCLPYLCSLWVLGFVSAGDSGLGNTPRTGALAGGATERKWGIEVADSRSFVGIARVLLSVGVLRVDEEGYLTGRFRVRVPLMSSKNDDGTIRIPMNASWEAIHTEGGELSGLAISDKPDTEPNKIECAVDAGEGTITLAIHTPDRTIVFESTYELRDLGEPEGKAKAAP